jgi:hypothetical protein
VWRRSPSLWESPKQQTCWRSICGTPGAVSDAGAIAEGLLGRALFPSAAHLQRYGYAEMYRPHMFCDCVHT